MNAEPTTDSTPRYRLEALQPCADIWDQVHPPEWWREEGDKHDGLWASDSDDPGYDVVKQFTVAYPNRHPEAKPYRSYRVIPTNAARRFRIVEEEC